MYIGWRVKATAADVSLACRVMGKLSAPVSDTNEQRLLDALGGFVNAALGAYPSSREEDEQEARDPDTPW